jgi:CrcB protein
MRERPPHLRLDYLGVVAAGGTVGTSARYLITQASPSSVQPWVVMIINIAGALLLGILLEALARRGPDRGRLRTLRLLLGTGVLGGFTTYSTLAVDLMRFLQTGSVNAAISYGLSSLLLGVAAAALGVRLASRLRARS